MNYLFFDTETTGVPRNYYAPVTDTNNWPRLEELYRKLFGRNFAGAHDAMSDIQATKECFFELKRRGIL